MANLNITGFTPSSGLTGIAVSISGSNFLEAAAVKFNTTVCTSFTIINDNEISAVVPSFATTGLITINTSSATSISLTNFNVIATPITTNVPFPTLGSTGYILPSDSDVLVGVIDDLQSAFGGNLNLDAINTSTLSTPQGQLASSMAAMISDCYGQFLNIVSQIDPLYAQGRMQDAIGYLYFLTRYPATPTLVSANCLGSDGAVISAGTAIAQDAAKNLYKCSGGTISSGTVSVVFTNVIPGNIPYIAPLSIYQSVSGWSGISGATQTQIGADVESSQAFEARRKASVSRNSNGILASIRAAIIDCYPNIACAVAENPTAGIETINGVVLPANSIYIAVAQIGGAISNAVGTLIAQAIYSMKPPGSAYAVTPGPYFATDYVSGQTYTVGFVEAYQTPVYFKVILASATNPPGSSLSLITKAINAAFSGADGQKAVGNTIGGTVYASRFYAGIVAALPGVAIMEINLGPTTSPTGFSQSLILNQIPIFQAVELVLV